MSIPPEKRQKIKGYNGSFHENKFVTDFTEKTELVNVFLAKECLLKDSKSNISNQLIYLTLTYLGKREGRPPPTVPPPYNLSCKFFVTHPDFIVTFWIFFKLQTDFCSASNLSQPGVRFLHMSSSGIINVSLTILVAPDSTGFGKNL